MDGWVSFHVGTQYVMHELQLAADDFKHSPMWFVYFVSSTFKE